MEFLQKAREKGLNPANIMAWLSITALNVFGKVWGTLRLHIKCLLFGVVLGKHVRAHGAVGILRWPGGKIVIGDNVSIISSWRRSTAKALAHPTRLRVFGSGGAIEIGNGTQISGASITARSKTIKIGSKVLLGPNCTIVDSDFHEPWPAAKRDVSPGYDNDAGVIIGDYVWIGMDSTILKGVTIGKGAIIGASSVVTRDVPPYCVACGNPARVVKRHAEEA